MTAGQPRLEEALLAQILADVDGPVAQAEDPALTGADLAELVAHQKAHVRETASAHPNLTAEQIQQLAADPQASVRVAVATRPTLPDEALAALVNDPDATVRRAVASRRGLAAAQLRRLAQDGHWSVAYALAANPATPQHIVEQMALHTEVDVARRVWMGCRVPAGKFLPRTLRDIQPGVFQWLAEQTGNADLFREMATDWSATTTELAGCVRDLRSSHSPQRGQAVT